MKKSPSFGESTSEVMRLKPDFSSLLFYYGCVREGSHRRLIGYILLMLNFSIKLINDLEKTKAPKKWGTFSEAFVA
jgi:hypothetical protein